MDSWFHSADAQTRRRQQQGSNHQHKIRNNSTAQATDLRPREWGGGGKEGDASNGSSSSLSSVEWINTIYIHCLFLSISPANANLWTVLSPLAAAAAVWRCYGVTDCTTQPNRPCPCTCLKQRHVSRRRRTIIIPYETQRQADTRTTDGTKTMSTTRTQTDRRRRSYLKASLPLSQLHNSQKLINPRNHLVNGYSCWRCIRDKEPQMAFNPILSQSNP